MLNSKEAYEKTIKSKPKDIRYVLKYIDKRIKDACNQGEFYTILNNKITRERFWQTSVLLYWRNTKNTRYIIY